MQVRLPDVFRCPAPCGPRHFLTASCQSLEVVGFSRVFSCVSKAPDMSDIFTRTVAILVATAGHVIVAVNIVHCTLHVSMLCHQKKLKTMSELIYCPLLVFISALIRFTPKRNVSGLIPGEYQEWTRGLTSD